MTKQYSFYTHVFIIFRFRRVFVLGALVCELKSWCLLPTTVTRSQDNTSKRWWRIRESIEVVDKRNIFITTPAGKYVALLTVCWYFLSATSSAQIYQAILWNIFRFMMKNLIVRNDSACYGHAVKIFISRAKMSHFADGKKQAKQNTKKICYPT